MDLALYVLEGPTVELPSAPMDDPPPTASLSEMSIRTAWNTFIGATPAPPAKRSFERVPVEASTFAQARTVFGYPSSLPPPPRLAAFALPSYVHADMADQPQDVCFCLTHSDGSRVHGSALQVCDPAEEEGRVVIRALVLLSQWPCYELWKVQRATHRAKLSYLTATRLSPCLRALPPALPPALAPSPCAPSRPIGARVHRGTDPSGHHGPID